MAGYNASARSNYFGVKDKEKFTGWCKSRELEPIFEKERTLCGFIVKTEYGNVPYCTCEDDGEWRDIDFFGELSTHVIDGDVAIVMEVGSEKMRYLRGMATAVNSKGETVTVTLDDIYEKAKGLGNSTIVEY